MVELFYYESQGKCCRKLLNNEGFPNKILLFPDEGWAASATNSYWILKAPWWSRSRCQVIEVSGTKKITTRGKMSDTGKGTMWIKGKFKQGPEPDFRLFLTTHVSPADFRMGYSMTGTLERGDRKKGRFQLTHHAMIKRKDY
ncbi:hypothetical protein CHUAL_004150 [Chamberlinius hualienensis]